MANLVCVEHAKRVVVIENAANGADVFHRNVAGNDSVRCNSARVTIDGDLYRPNDLLDWGTDKYIDNFLSDKHDALIYS